MYSLSVIVICRFHLTLQERNQQRLQRTVSSYSFVITTFHDAAEKLHNLKVEGFGDSSLGRSLHTGTTNDKIEDQQHLPQLIRGPVSSGQLQFSLRSRELKLSNVIAPHLSLGSNFYAVAQRMHNAVVEEFGDVCSTRSGTGTLEEEMEDQNTLIDIDEFLYATGTLGRTGTASSVASGERQPRYRTC